MPMAQLVFARTTYLLIYLLTYSLCCLASADDRNIRACQMGRPTIIFLPIVGIGLQNTSRSVVFNRSARFLLAVAFVPVPGMRFNYYQEITYSALVHCCIEAPFKQHVACGQMNTLASQHLATQRLKMNAHCREKCFLGFSDGFSIYRVGWGDPLNGFSSKPP